MSTLFDINQKYLQIISELEENGGEATEEIEEALTITREEVAVKVSNYNWILAKIHGDVTLANNEITRLEDFKESKLRLIEKLEEKLLQSLLLFGIDDTLTPKQIRDGKEPVKRLQCGLITLSTRKTPPSVEIISESDIPNTYKKVDVTIQNLDVVTANSLKASLAKKEFSYKENVKPDKKKIADDIKSGIQVEGASLISKLGLSIK